MRRLSIILWCVLVMAICLVTGCADDNRKDPDLWGNGDPPADYIEQFGNGNTARLNYVQTQSINRQGQMIAELHERVRILEPADHSDCVLDENGFCLTADGCKVVK